MRNLPAQLMDTIRSLHKAIEKVDVDRPMTLPSATRTSQQVDQTQERGQDFSERVEELGRCLRGIQRGDDQGHGRQEINIQMTQISHQSQVRHPASVRSSTEGLPATLQRANPSIRSPISRERLLLS
jgi:hypothetical protein